MRMSHSRRVALVSGLLLPLALSAKASGLDDQIKSIHVRVLKSIAMLMQGEEIPSGMQVPSAYYQDGKQLLAKALDRSRPYCMVLHGLRASTIEPQDTERFWDEEGFGTDSSPGDFRFVFQAPGKGSDGSYFRMEFYCFRKDTELTLQDILGSLGDEIALEIVKR